MEALLRRHSREVPLHLPLKIIVKITAAQMLLADTHGTIVKIIILRHYVTAVKE